MPDVAARGAPRCAQDWIEHGPKGPQIHPKLALSGAFSGGPEGPQRAQIEPSRANCSQIWPKLARSWPQQAPRTPPCALLGPQEAPPELPKGPQESPPRGSKSNMNLRHYPMMIFFLFLTFWGTGPIAKIIVFPRVIVSFSLTSYFDIRRFRAPIWRPFGARFGAPKGPRMSSETTAYITSKLSSLQDHV